MQMRHMLKAIYLVFLWVLPGVTSLAALTCLPPPGTPANTCASVITGNEQLIGPGLWDTGVATITIDGYSKSFPYGQFSTVDSITAGLAGTVGQDPASPAYTKSAKTGGVIYVVMKNGGTPTRLRISFSTDRSFSGGSTSNALADTTTTVTLSATNVPYGSSPTVSGAVSCGNACGDVVLHVDNATFGTVSLASNGTYAFSAPSSLPNGSHTVSVSYKGNGNYAPSISSPVSYSVYTGPSAPSILYGYAINAYEPGGNISAYADLVNGSWTNIRYDSLDRLVAATAVLPGTSTRYLCWSYDSFGNRLSQTASTTPCNVANPPVPTSSWGYNAQNRVSFASTAPAGLTYDESGNVTYDGVNHYLFDAEGRVCAVSYGDPLLGGTPKTQYIYDGGGTRVAKVSIATWSCDLRSNSFNESDGAGYVLDTNGRQLSEVNGSHVWQHTNAFAGGELVATYSSTGLQFHFSDWLGTQRAHTDYAGTNLSGCSSDPFGDNKQCAGTSATEHFFTGKERDSESGLDYFGARYYGGNMGRFASPDPGWFLQADLATPQTWNQYSYVLNNPLRFVDPTGMECVWDDGSFDSATDPGTAYHDNCKKAGGTWVDPKAFSTLSAGDWSKESNAEISAVAAALNDNSITVDVSDNGTTSIEMQSTSLTGLVRTPVTSSSTATPPIQGPTLPNCYAVEAITFAEDLNPFSPGWSTATGLAADGAAAASEYKATRAAIYAGLKTNTKGGIGLIHPLKSSTYRGLMAQSRAWSRTNAFITIGTIDVAAVHAGYAAFTTPCR